MKRTKTDPNICYKKATFVATIADLPLPQNVQKPDLKSIRAECAALDSKTVADVHKLTLDNGVTIHTCLAAHHVESDPILQAEYAKDKPDRKQLEFPIMAGKNAANKDFKYCQDRNRFPDIYSYAGGEILPDEYMNGSIFKGSVTLTGDKYTYNNALPKGGKIYATNAPMGKPSDLYVKTKLKDADGKEVECNWVNHPATCVSRKYAGASTTDTKENTVFTFWKGVSKNNINFVVQLTQFYAFKKECGNCEVKADKYYAFEKDEVFSVTKGTATVKVTCKTKTKDDEKESEVRTLEVEFTDTNKAAPQIANVKVTHYYYMGFPDFQAPSVKLVKLVEEMAKQKDAGKNLIAHCTGGVGRTGTFVASVLVKQAGKLDATKKFPIVTFIMQLRQVRNWFVEAGTQVEFITKHIIGA